MTTDRTMHSPGEQPEVAWPTTHYGLVAPRRLSSTGVREVSEHALRRFSEAPARDRPSLLLPHAVSAKALQLRVYAAQGSPFVLLATCVASLAYAVTMRMVEPLPTVRMVERVADPQPVQLTAATTVTAATGASLVAVTPAPIARAVIPERRAKLLAKASSEPAKLEPATTAAAAREAQPTEAVTASASESAALQQAEPSALPLPAWLVQAGDRAGLEAKPVRAVTPVAQVQRAVTPTPVAVAQVQRHAVASVEALQVRGALPASVVKRGMSRLEPQYHQCGELCSGAGQSCLHSRFQLQAVIDETGHGRDAHVQGPSHPAVQRCLERVTASLVVAPPDTGVARVQGIVRFSSPD